MTDNVAPQPSSYPMDTLVAAAAQAYLNELSAGGDPVGDASAANQVIGNSSLATIATAIQGTLEVEVVDTLPLPTGAATAAKQDTGNTSVASIDTKTPALGQALAAASVPIVLTAAQVTTLTPPAAITGFATQTTLASILTNTPALGQALAAASTPVVLTAAQVTALTPPTTVTALSGGNSYSHIATSTTTTVKSGAGVLHTITINALGTVASAITIYDSATATGTVIAVINSLSISGTLTYDVAFTTGLTIVSTGTVAPDITVSYR